MNRICTSLALLIALPLSSCSLIHEQITKQLPADKDKQSEQATEAKNSASKEENTINGEHSCELGGSMLIKNFDGVQSSPTVIYRGEEYSMAPYTHPTANYLTFLSTSNGETELLIGSSVYFSIKSPGGETVESCRSTGLTNSQNNSQAATFPVTCYTRTSDGSPIKEYSMLNPPVINTDAIPMANGSVVTIYRFSYGTEIGNEIYSLQKPYGPNSTGTWLPAQDLKRKDGKPCNSGFKVIRR